MILVYGYSMLVDQVLKDPRNKKEVVELLLSLQRDADVLPYEEILADKRKAKKVRDELIRMGEDGVLKLYDSGELYCE